MEAIHTGLSRHQDNMPFALRNLQSSRTQVAAVTDSRSVDMSLVTEEGDRVTFSLDAKSSAFYASHAEIGMDGDRQEINWMESGGSRFEQEMSLKVEGHLNDQERHEIKRVMKTLQRMMNRFVQGKMRPMAAEAQKLQGLETIDRLDAHLSVERQVMVAQETHTAVSYDRTGGIAPLKAPTAYGAEKTLMDDAKALARDMAAEVIHSQAPKDPLQDLADRLLDAYREQEAKYDPTVSRVMDRIRDLFDAAMDDFSSHLR